MNCKNCHTQLSLDSQYCNQCGGKVIKQRITIKNLFEDFAERYLSYDNKFLQTFLTLFKAPQKVVNGYINGERTNYVNPFTYLLIAITVSGLNIYLMKKGFYGELDFNFNKQDTASKIAMNNFMSKIFDYHSFITILFIPFFAVLSKLVFWKRKDFNLAEHAIVYIYTFNHTSIISLFLMIIVAFFMKNYMLLSLIMYPVILGYHFYALKKIFNLTFKQMLLKFLLFLVLLITVYIALIIIGGIIMFVYMRN